MTQQATLFHGPESVTIKKAIFFLQSILCPSKGCAKCFKCLQIAAKKESDILWLTPKYTLESLEPIFDKVTLQVDIGKHFFFIIEKADLLPLVCANKLLKLVEEPPRGYHFIFLTELINALPKTILSRCALVATENNDSEERIVHPLLTFFMKKNSDPVLFYKTLMDSTPNEQETPLLLDALIQKTTAEYKEKIIIEKKSDTTFLSIIKIYQEALEKLPAQGGSKLFWKNLYLAKHFLENAHDTAD